MPRRMVEVGADDEADDTGLVNKASKTVDSGPPPDFAKRYLIFDSLSKIIGKSFAKGASARGANAGSGETRGTYVYTWGAGYHGQLGRKFLRGKKKYATVPRRVDMDCAVRQVACGGLHTACVTDGGLVYTWGDARGSQLGYQPLGFTNNPQPTEVQAMTSMHVFAVQVECGQVHTVALTNTGALISFGLSKSGQCGHGDRQAVKLPKKINVPFGLKFIDISCGDRHTAALSDKGEVYTFGCGEHGQLGHGDDKSISSPALIESMVGINVVSVVCGSIHTCFITDMGDLYVCGFGEHFYPNEEQNFFYLPVKIPFKEKVVQVACGQSHIIALTDKGDVFCWGSGGYGQLGHGVKGNLSVPRLVLTGKQISQVAAGRYHSMALTCFGVLYSWGCGENGQLGHHDDNNLLFPRVIEPNIGTVVGQIACGEHHTAVLTSKPWAKVDIELQNWLSLEVEEFSRKLNYLKNSTVGLFRKDLLKIEEEMERIRGRRKEERKQNQLREDRERGDDLASVLTREQIMSQINKDETGARFLDRDEPHELPSSLTDKDKEEKGPKPRKKPAGKHSMGDKRKMAAMGLSPRPASANDAFAEAPPGGNPNLGLLTERKMVAPTTAPVDRSGMSQRAVFLKESAAMVQRMQQIISDTGDSSNESRLQQMLAVAFDFRKEYDCLKDQSNKKAKILEDSKQAVVALKKNNFGVRDRKKKHTSRLEALAMKLNTVTIKITETEENRKNYALNIAHLKEEELVRYYQLEALRNQCADYDAFCKKLNEMKLQSLEEKDRAESELAAFQSEIKNFQSFISDQLGKFESISKVARQRREKRETEKEHRSTKIREKVTGRIVKLNNEMEEKNKEAAAMAQQLESVNERLRYFEKRFQQIASATGLTNPDAIINKYALKEEIKQELNFEIANKKKSIEELKSNLVDLKTEEQESAASFVNSKWKDVHMLQNDLTVSDAKATKHKKEADRLEQTLAYFQEGLFNLSSEIPSEFEVTQPLDANALSSGVFNEKMTLKCLQQLEEQLGQIVTSVEEGSEAMLKRESELAKLKHSEVVLDSFRSKNTSFDLSKTIPKETSQA